MKIKETIREKISQHLDVLIPSGKWEQYINLLDKDGVPNRKQLIGIFMIICQHVETLERLMEDVYFRLDKINKDLPTDEILVPEKTFKLRTQFDVTTELNKQYNPSTKSFHLSKIDWGILEKSIDPAVNDPSNGYGKELDPKDKKVKTCLYYKDLPVFEE